MKITMNKKVQIGCKNYDITGDDNYLNNVGASFEPNLIKLYSILVSKDDIVADIGDCICLASIWFSKHIKKLYSFEPSLTTFKILKRNLAIASATNVDADNTDGGSKDGK